MRSQVDHIVVVAHSLDDGAEYVERALGVQPGPGRAHPHMGTHNLLLSLGSDVYLEVVSIDPAARPIGRPRWFGLDRLPLEPKASLASWVVRTDNIHAPMPPELGSVEKMEREGIVWHMTVTPDGDHPMSGAAPLVIQRQVTIHPASRLPDLGFRLRGLHVRARNPSQVDRLLSQIKLQGEPPVTVEVGSHTSLLAEIETPSGLRTLGEASQETPSK